MFLMINFKKIFFVFTLFLAILLFQLFSVFANEKTKKTIQQNLPITYIESEKLLQILQSPNYQNEYLIFDTRNKLEYLKEHIKDSLYLKSEISEEYLKQIIPDKNMKIILYCSNELCGLAKDTAEKIRKFGYNNLYILNGGLKKWKSKKLPTTKEYNKINILPEMITPGKLDKIKDMNLIIEVKTEFNTNTFGSIENAVVFDDDDFCDSIAAILKTTNKKMVATYSFNTNIGKLAAEYICQQIEKLQLKNIEKVYYLEGGIHNWLACGKKVKKY